MLECSLVIRSAAKEGEWSYESSVSCAQYFCQHKEMSSSADSTEQRLCSAKPSAPSVIHGLEEYSYVNIEPDEWQLGHSSLYGNNGHTFTLFCCDED